jgi:hypothetical protein
MIAFDHAHDQLILLYTPEQSGPSWVDDDARRFVIDAVSRRISVPGVPATHDGNGLVDE